MITGKDIYDVLTTLVPLYVAMILAYGSVRWWKIFTREQCAGINRFVAVFAVPLLSFHFISSNNPYDMNYRYIAADSLQKVVVLILLFLWQAFFLRGSRSGDWLITLFSLSTLPNTLIMGIPLLKAMYGDFTTPLMVQTVVLQSVIWYTIIIIMFEYRSGKALIAEKFPDTAASIASFHIESSISTLDGHNSLEVDTEIADGGRLHVVLRRRSPSSLGSHAVNSIGSTSMTPYAPALSDAEIYSLQSSPVQSCNEMDFCGMVASRMMSPRSGYVGNCHGEAHSIMLSSASSNSSEGGMEKDCNRKRKARRMGGGGMFPPFPGPYDSESVWRKKKEEGWRNKGLHMFVWSSSDSSLSDGNFRHAATRDSSTDFGALDASTAVVPHHIDARRGFQKRSEYSNSINKIRKNREIEREDDHQIRMISSAITRPFLDRRVADTPKEERKNGAAPHQMPPSTVMTKLILIMVWRKLIRNPNTYASVIGIVWSLISFRWNIDMPCMVKGSISLLSDTGLGMATFSLGLFMALQTKMIACGKSAAASSMAVRFLVGPAIMAATSAAMGIRGELLQVSIVQAALPQGIVPFVFAKEYDCHADILSTGVIFGMVIALPITIIYYILLGL